MKLIKPMKYLLFIVLALSLFIEPLKDKINVYLIAQVIDGECNTCSREEKIKIGEVIISRKYHNQFPNTIHQIITQESQFQGHRYDIIPSEENVEIGEYVYLNIKEDKEIYFFMSNYPSWVVDNLVCVVGNDSGFHHNFYTF